MGVANITLPKRTASRPDLIYGYQPNITLPEPPPLALKAYQVQQDYFAKTQTSRYETPHQPNVPLICKR